MRSDFLLLVALLLKSAAPAAGDLRRSPTYGQSSQVRQIWAKGKASPLIDATGVYYSISTREKYG